MSQTEFLQIQTLELERLLQEAGDDPVLRPQLQERLSEARNKLRMDKQSSVAPLFRMIDKWEHTTSWAGRNDLHKKTLCLAIQGQFPFREDDFSTLYDRYRGDRWFGEHLGERYYCLAVSCGNTSAARAYEAFRRRPPFIADDVTLYFRRNQHWKRQRLVLGSRFPWKGEMVEVTSFAKQGTHLTACSYEQDDGDSYKRPKVKHRYRITPDDLKANRKKAQEAE